MSKGSATEALESLDLSTDVVRAEVAKLPEAPWTRHLAEETEEVLQQARIEATTLRHPWIRSGHLLLALLDQPQATRILSALGASDGTVRNRVLERLEATALELNSDVPAKRAT
jgi:ATP-dependent Clp protease ATP-binding subunit ClpA